MADIYVIAYWSTAWGVFALWAWRINYRRDVGETSRRCRGVQLWTSTAERRAD